jgi:hypothetical protein
MASYPSTIKSFTTKAAADTIQASHINDLQDEIVAIETDLVNVFSHSLSNTSQPRAVVRNTSTQSIPTSTWTALTFATDDTDIGDMHSPSVNTSRLTVPSGEGGIYLVHGAVSFGASASGVRGIRLFLNGGATASLEQYVPGFSTSSVGPTVMVTELVSLAAGDYLEVQVFQDTGGSISTVAGARAQILKIW